MAPMPPVKYELRTESVERTFDRGFEAGLQWAAEMDEAEWQELRQGLLQKEEV